MRQQQIILMTVVMFMFLIFIAAGGYYYTTTLEEETEKKTGSCSGTDANGVYEYDDDGNCVFKECKSGYALEGGYCIRQRDYTADMDAGNIPVNCEIGGYIEGPCVNEFGRQLTGMPGSCGTGTKTFTSDPSVFKPANALGGCDEGLSYTETCEVPCIENKCLASEEHYTKTDGVCRGLDNLPLGGDTNRCGTGYQIFDVNPDSVVGFATTELRDAWIAENWKDCTPLKKPCDVICKEGMEPSGCPILGNDMQTSWVNDYKGDKACFPKEVAYSLLEGKSVYDDFNMPYEKLTYEAAKARGINSMSELNRGFSIKYKSGVVDFSEMVQKGCTTAQLVPCDQPTYSSDCEYEKIYTGTCSNEACGDKLYKPFEMQVKRPAWGEGECNKPDVMNGNDECLEEEPKRCCDPDIDSDWKADPVEQACPVSGFFTYEANPFEDECETRGATGDELNASGLKMVPCCYETDWVPEDQCIDGGENDGKIKSTRFSTAGCGKKSNDGTDVQYTETFGDKDCRQHCQYTPDEIKWVTYCERESPSRGPFQPASGPYIAKCQKYTKYKPIPGSANATGVQCLAPSELGFQGPENLTGVCPGHIVSCDPATGGVGVETITPIV